MIFLMSGDVTAPAAAKKIASSRKPLEGRNVEYKGRIGYRISVNRPILLNAYAVYYYRLY